MKTTTKLLSMLIMLCAFNLNAINIFVKPTGGSSATGTSWATAATLSRAMTLAVNNNDIIYFAAGDYDVATSTQWNTVSLKSGATLIGGFSGTENEATINTSMSNPTVNGNTRFYASAPVSTKIFSLGITTGTPATITVKNINFEDISSTTSTLSTLVFSIGTNQAPLVVDGCNFRRLSLSSTASNNATVMSYPGVSVNLTIQNCSFQDISSTSTTSGVFRLNITATPNTVVEFKNCSAKNISLTGTAGTGAFVSTYHTTVTNTGDKGYYKLTDCIFDNCTSLGAGAVLNAGQKQSWTISGCVIKNCSSGSYGGAIYLGGAASPNDDALIINNSCIVSNTSVSTKQAVSYGTSTGCAVTISRSVITNNSNGGTGVRDILDPASSVTYSASESLLNGAYVGTADNTYRGATTYNDYLTSTQLQTITNASSLSNAIAAGQALIDQAKLATQNIQPVDYNNHRLSINGKTLELPSVVDEIDVYSISGSLLNKVSNSGKISLNGISHGIYLVKVKMSGAQTVTKICI